MRKYLLIIFVVIIAGCKSTDLENPGESTSLLGVVFDKRSNPVKNASLTIKSLEDEILFTMNTDIDGQFFIPELQFGNYIVEIRAKRSAFTVIEIEHFDIENILVIRLPTFQDLISDLENSLRTDDIVASEKQISDLDSIDDKDIYYNYLKAIFLVKIEMYVEAKDLLLSIEDENYSYIYLLLADIYEYHLDNKLAAIKYLKRFNNNEYNEDSILRFEELKNES